MDASCAVVPQTAALCVVFVHVAQSQSISLCGRKHLNIY